MARETRLVKACLDVLQIKGCIVWRQNQGMMRYEYKGKAGVVPFTRGVKGISDIIGLTPSGRFLAVEAKVGKNTTTPEQAAFIARVNRAGGLGLVVYSVTELIQRLDEAKV
jgi:hypothetical protein